HQVRIMDLMERLRVEQGTTVVMVSHDVNLAAMYASRVLLLKAGRMLKMGPPGDVMTYATLEEAYGCKLLVDDSPLGDFPRVTLVPERYMHPDQPPDA
ncbi:MAG: ABC transporter ATP-binding protein, partial [Deltaproteobacteria bacterium]|nr:ABC transporter ATP-binding protein [Deltaproteobacteria bacterium]